MKYNCDIIQDLLPLYEEGLCSDASAQAVREHLAACETCRKLTGTLPIAAPENPPKADRAVANSMKKVKRRWQTSLIAALLVIPLLLLSLNQFRGRGVCWTNTDDIFTAWRFIHALETENWERAANLHDYSEDYESIMEALALPVEIWGHSFTPVKLDGEDWMLRSYLDCNAMEGDAANALFHFLYNRVGSAMIPVELWTQVIAVDEAAVQQEGWQFWLNDEYYSKVTTPWGDFVISDGRHYDAAAEYCAALDLVPAAVYEEARDDLADEAQYVYDQTHAHYDYVQGLSEEQFLTHMERQYAADLKSLEDLEVTFECTGYQSAYRLWENDGWHIQFGVTITYQDKSLDTTMSIGLRDGRVRIVSLSHLEPADWLYVLEKALYPSAHPDY